MGRNILVIIVSLLCSLSVNGQKYQLSTDNKKAISLYQTGNNSARRFQYKQAIESFEAAIKKDSQFLEAYFALGAVYKRTKDYQRAQSIFEQGIAAASTQSQLSRFYKIIGETYFATTQYKKAAGYLQSYLDVVKPPDKNLQKELRQMIRNARFAEKAIQEPVDFSPERVSSSVNRFPVQYFPVLTADEEQLIYTARRGTTAGADENIYVATKDSLGQWQPSRLISPKISRPGINEGACSISADGRVLVFTICKDRRGLGSCDLYISYKVGDNWSYPQNMKAPVNSAKWESQPSLSADGRTLYFVSDRSGGLGKMDIWKSTMAEDGTWTKPENLDNGINTPYDDITPFIHANGKTLYFASKGYPGFGGYDLFSATEYDSVWSKPKNLGYPLNDLEDQISLFVTPDGATGYFSKEEEVNFTYKSDVYQFAVPTGDRVKVKSIYLSGKVSDKETGKYLGAKIEIFNKESSKKVFRIASDSVNGSYLAVLNEGGNYGMYISRPGYLFRELDVNLKQSEQLLSYDTVNIALEPVKSGSVATLKNIFFDLDKYTLKSASVPELEVFTEFLRRNVELNVEIRGHTDNIGTETYNLDLSQKRAKAVYQFLLDKGIDRSRLLYTGKGSKYPVATNESEAGRRQNRRIEFIIR